MPSFDIVSEVDMQELDNAVNQVKKEIQSRYDFKGSKSEIELSKNDNLIKIIADDDYKMQAMIDILTNKAIKRNISPKALNPGEVSDSGGSLKKCDVALVVGIDKEKGKEIIKFIKESKIKVQPSIQDDKVRVSGKKRDDLQEVITLVKGHDFKIPLQFINFRE
jgi:hypothetical protein